MTSEFSKHAQARTNWRSRAACRGGTNPDLFFPVEEDGVLDERQVAEAKVVCAGCAVREACLEEALARIPDGIAGGMTPRERHRAALGRTAVRPRLAGDELARLARTRAEVAEAGAALLAVGRSARAIARICGVSERTVARWRARSATRQSLRPGVVTRHEAMAPERAM